MRQVDQTFRTLEIHFAIGVQEPENDSVHAELLGRPDVILHDFKLRSGVHKIARSWANDDVDGQTKIYFEFQVWGSNYPLTIYANGSRVAMGEDLEPILLFRSAQPKEKITIAVKAPSPPGSESFVQPIP